MVFTKSYMVYLPEGYDGLVFAAELEEDNYKDCAKMMQLDSILPEASIMDIVFAAELEEDNYKDCAKMMQLDSILPEASIMDIELVDPNGCLFFNICN